MNSGLTSHQQRGHTETEPRFKVTSERPEKRGNDLAIAGEVGLLSLWTWLHLTPGPYHKEI